MWRDVLDADADNSRSSPTRIPSNAKFQSFDVESQWNLGTASWDLIHVRCLNGVVRNWPSLYSIIHSHLIPGIGHIEHIEIDWTPRLISDGGLGDADTHILSPQSSKLALWVNILHECMEHSGTGRSLRVNPDETRAELSEAGFVDVSQSTYRMPFSRRQRPSTPSAPPTESEHVVVSPAMSFTGRTRTSLPSLSSFSFSPPSSRSQSIFPLDDDDEEEEEEGDEGGDIVRRARHSSSSRSERRDSFEKWFPRAFDLWLEGLTLMPLLKNGYALEAIHQLIADVRQELADPTMQACCTM